MKEPQIMPRIFSPLNIFLTLLVLISLGIPPSHSQQKKGGTGKGNQQERSNSPCKDPSNPTLTLILEGKESWVLTPEEVMALPGNYQIEKGPNNKLKALNLMAILPEGWDGGRVSFISCKGQRINVPAPHLKKKNSGYILNKNRKGFIKLIRKSDDDNRVLMRDLRRIDVR